MPYKPHLAAFRSFIGAFAVAGIQACYATYVNSHDFKQSLSFALFAGLLAGFGYDWHLFLKTK